MKPGKVRPIAICVFRNKGKILVSKGYDEVKDQNFFRPLGGRIEFGEKGDQTVKRELYEELELEVSQLQYLGTLENIFTYNGQKGHEIILVYDGKFNDPETYNLTELFGMEDDDEPIHAIWKPISDFKTKPPKKKKTKIPPLYPDGLYELLMD